jgi:cephalosporin hydroxylase
MPNNVYGSDIPNSVEFEAERSISIVRMSTDNSLRREALQLQLSAEEYGYGYQQTWCGVPVIRTPDDILCLQEMIWTLRPAFVIETGVARGGGLILAAELMRMAGVSPHVLGLDIQILAHARSAIESYVAAGEVETWEGDSSSIEAGQRVTDFLAPFDAPGLLILDSDHSHDHVLKELQIIATHLPKGSYVIVADTIIEEVEVDHYPNRPWGRGNSPLTAANSFLIANPDFTRDSYWSRRSLVTEFRDGILKRIQ